MYKCTFISNCINIIGFNFNIIQNIFKCIKCNAIIIAKC